MNQYLSIAAAVSIPLVVWTGTMIWWMSRTNAEVKSLKKDTDGIKHDIADQKREARHMQEQIQALAVNEANVAGTLSTFALEIRQIRQYIEDQYESNGLVLEAQLKEQTAALVNKFRDMLDAAQREWFKRNG